MIVKILSSKSTQKEVMNYKFNEVFIYSIDRTPESHGPASVRRLRMCYLNPRSSR